MLTSWWRGRRSPPAVALYHDIEQNSDSTADVQTCRRMVQEFLHLENLYGIPATYNVVGKLYQEQPDLIAWISAAGQELAFHSYHHYSDWQPCHYAAEVQRCRALAPQPRGYRSPRSDWDEQTLHACAEAGFTWNAESDRAATPYRIYQGLVRIPIAGDDWPLQTGKRTPTAWVAHFQRLLRQRSFVAFGCHDCVVSEAPAERLRAWEDILRAVCASQVRCLSFSAAAEHYQGARASVPPRVTARTS